MRILILLLILGLFPYFAQAEELKRTEEGVRVAKDNYLNIPSDMQVRKVAGNVITPEDDAAYIARKIDEQNKRIDEMKAKLDTFDSRLQALEAKK